MKQIGKFDISRLRTDEDFGFHKKIEAKTALLTSDTDKIIVAQYVESILAFDKSLKQNEKNSHTEAVAQADEMADASYRGLKAQAKAMLNFPSEAQRTIAKQVWSIMEKYGDITELAYSEEYGRMFNVLEELDAIPAESHTLIMTDVWLAELHKYYDQYMAAVAAQSTESGEYVTGAVKTARKATDKVYQTLVQYVNSMCAVLGEAVYGAFIDEVNFFVDREKKNLEARKPDEKPEEEKEEETIE